MALKRRSGAADGRGAVVLSDPDLASLAPTLLEFLSQTTWEDKSERKTGTVMVLCEDGLFKAWLHDRDGQCSCWVSGGTMLDLLGSLEKLLVNGDGNWRKDVGKGRR